MSIGTYAGNVAYAGLSSAMERLGLIEEELEGRIDDAAGDWWYESGMNQREI